MPPLSSPKMSPSRPLLTLLAITALVSCVVAVKVPLTSPAGYLPQVVEWATSGHVAGTLEPQGEPLFVGPAFRLGGIRAVLVLQVLLQIALAAVCYLLLRALRLPPRWSAYGSLPVALNPEFILSVAKVWDLTLSAVLFLLFVLCCLRIAQAAPALKLLHTLVASLIFAAAIFCRPNLLCLLPVLLMAALHGRSKVSRSALVGHLAVFTVSVAALFALFGLASHGSPFIARNGPYNLYAGHNPRTEAALLNQLNAEFSLPADFADSHPGEPLTNIYAPTMSSYFTRQTILFARHHPGEEIKLVFLKLFTLFRPDTKVHPLVSPFGLMKAALALPVFLLLAALLLPPRPALSFDDYLLFATELLYILPFLLTNADPRFRISLDALFLLHLVSLLYRRRHRQSFATASTLAA
jgi:hypothetical protein